MSHGRHCHFYIGYRTTLQMASNRNGLLPRVASISMIFAENENLRNEKFLERSQDNGYQYKQEAFERKPSTPIHHVFSFIVNCGFPLLISPFCVNVKGNLAGEDEQAGGSMSVYQFWWHKGLCAIVQLLCFISLLLWTFGTIAQVDFRAKPESFFGILLMMSTVLYTIAVYYIYWFRKTHVISMLKELKVPVEVNSKRKNWILLTLTIFKILTSIVHLTVGRGSLVLKRKPKSWLDHKIMITELTFSVDIEEGNITNIQAILIGYTAIGNLQNAFVLGIATIIFFAGVASAHRISSSYKLAISSAQSVLTRIQLYKDAKRKIGLINKAVGPVSISALLLIIVNTALHIGRPNNTCRGATCSLNEFSFVFHVLGLIIAAEAHSKMKSLERAVIISAHHMKSPFNCVETAAIISNSEGANGIKGLGFFTISYPFLGSVMSVCMTYGLVVLQFAAEEEPKPESTN